MAPLPQTGAPSLRVETKAMTPDSPPPQAEANRTSSPGVQAFASPVRPVKLGKGERRWTAGVLEALYPSGAVAGMPGANDVNLIDFYDEYVSLLPLLSSVGLRAVIFLVAFTPFLFIGSLRPVHRLSREKRELHLHRWATSNVYWIREGITLIKAATLMGYAGHPDVQRAIGMRS